jgi:serine/threonine protein kinase
MDPFPIDGVLRQLGDRFEIGEPLSRGGQGIVYRAKRIACADGRADSTYVALKFYLHSSQDERVKREIVALQDYPHPNLAHLLEHGSVILDGRPVPFIVWEFVVGQALNERLRKGPLPPSTVARIGRDVAKALDHIWKKRIVHRDVNPKNIILRTGEMEAVLIDLGVARHLDRTPITGPGITWGTRGYLSPEQCRAESNLTCGSDVFSLGVSLQEALCARHPTDGDQRRLLGTRPVTLQIAPQTHKELAAMIDSMLRPRSAFRPLPGRIVQECERLATLV